MLVRWLILFHIVVGDVAITLLMTNVIFSSKFRQAAARRPAQLVLFRIAVPTTPAQTVSWSLPIINPVSNGTSTYIIVYISLSGKGEVCLDISIINEK